MRRGEAVAAGLKQRYGSSAARRKAAVQAATRHQAVSKKTGGAPDEEEKNCISTCQCHMGQMSESFDIPLPPGRVHLYSLAGKIHSTVERVPARPKDTVARSNLHLDLPVSQLNNFGAFWDVHDAAAT